MCQLKTNTKSDQYKEGLMLLNLEYRIRENVSRQNIEKNGGGKQEVVASSTSAGNKFSFFSFLCVPHISTWLKWCIHLRRSLFLYFNYLVSVTAGGPRSPRGHM